MEKSKEQNNIVCYHLGKRRTLYVHTQTQKRKYAYIKEKIFIYIHKKQIILLWRGKLDDWGAKM